MTFREFHNGLRVLANIDRDEFVAKGLPDADWPSFRDDPWRYFIRASDVMAEGLFEIIESRAVR